MTRIFELGTPLDFGPRRTTSSFRFGMRSLRFVPFGPVISKRSGGVISRDPLRMDGNFFVREPVNIRDYPLEPVTTRYGMTGL